MKLLAKIGIWIVGILGVFGIVGTGFIIIRDTGKMPPRPDTQVDALLEGFENGSVSVRVNRNFHTVYAKNIPQREEDHAVYEIGAAADPLTAMAFMILHDRGELDFDDEIGSVLTDLPEGLARIPFHQLLTHTSGLSAGFDPAVDVQPDLEQGGASVYSPANYALLNRALTAISGQPFDIFILQHILAPLDMEDTAYERLEDTESGEGARGWVSCAEDLEILERSYIRRNLVKLETMLRAFKPPRVAHGKRAAFAFGWTVDNLGGLRIEQAASLGPGANACITRFSEKNYAVVILSDLPSDVLDSRALGREISAIYLGREMPYRKIVKPGQDGSGEP